MKEIKPSGTLPSELIDEKTFYSLGGASAGVLLVCWAINYVFVDVSWLDYKIYRLIGLLLSEAFAVIILFQKKERTLMKWVFAFLNGLLIFVNASGLNTMTSGYMFNPKVEANITHGRYFHFQSFRADAYNQASIFPLPRMINWWPDENLIAQNVQLTETNAKLITENEQLKTFFGGTPDQILPVTSHNDSLDLLKSQIFNKQRRIDELEATLKDTGNELQQQLAACIAERTRLSDSLKFYIQNFISCQQSYRKLMEEYSRLQKAQGDCDSQIKIWNRKLDVCMNEKSSLQETVNALNGRIAELTNRVKELEGRPATNAATLTELFKQVCELNGKLIRYKAGIPLPDDARLKKMPFYTKIDWAAFCRDFNNWYLVKDVKID